jgi:hypothetical protein
MKSYGVAYDKKPMERIGWMWEWQMAVNSVSMRLS